MGCTAAKFDPVNRVYHCKVFGEKCIYRYIPNGKKCDKVRREDPDVKEVDTND